MSRRQNKTRLHIIVEGQTEETFIREIIRPYLFRLGITTHWHVIINSAHKNRVYRGGVSSGTYGRLRADVFRLLDTDLTVTTMFDFYGLPGNFPGACESRAAIDPYEKVQIIEDAMRADIGSDRFMPFITLHEFESLLFSDIRKIDEVMRAHGRTRIDELYAIRNEYLNPEEINTDPLLSPSHRLKQIYPSYQKISDGILIAHRISLSKIRRSCRHFDAWMTTLESLSSYREPYSK